MRPPRCRRRDHDDGRVSANLAFPERRERKDVDGWVDGWGKTDNGTMETEKRRRENWTWARGNACDVEAVLCRSTRTGHGEC
jgi:hypothetical protein